MNKHELLSELSKRIKETKNNYMQPFMSFEHGCVVAYQNIIKLVEQLDEPQKVKVPKCVAEWIELCKEKADLSSCLNGYYEIGDGTIVRPRGLSETFYDWLSDYDHMHDLARAYLDGYEVDEEPLYTVTINLDLNYYLALDEGDGDDEISTTLTTGHDVLGYRYFLTEKEIKSADENLWPFAVPVDGSVEEV